MDKAHLITYLVSLAFIVSGLIVCCILYLLKDKINKVTPDNIDNINSNIKDFIGKSMIIGVDFNTVYIGKQIKENADYTVEEFKKQNQTTRDMNCQQ
ncbi:hypothetical protein [Campylobacter jejuni]|uniref:hypothetical protein n=1 Tax=Campylobacter jejuni TaxID=197 RepID=UPI000F809807|nr:hypothetical protein [Campylobacter jejuni]RTI81071.1 hypothetical protein C3I10_08880 [Campylobacter jejuni]